MSERSNSSVRVAETKSGKKRKAKTTTATPPPVEETTTDAKVNGHAEGESESPYLRELQKHIRNTNKKLAAISKTESAIAEHRTTGISLTDLVAQKKINADQKAQVEKKPGLEAELAKLEQQQKTFLEFSQDLEGRFEKRNTAQAESHEAEIARLKEEAAELATKDVQSKVREALQVACQFLHAAAFQRQREDVDEVESKAYEAVLFHLYQGNSTALDTITSVVDASDEKIVDPTSGDILDYTFSQLKVSAMATLSEDQAEPQEPEIALIADEPATDPTVANAGLTELEDTATIPISSETSPDDVPSAMPEQASTTEDAANAVAEAWNPEASMTTENTQTGEDWVQVPRDPAETETGSAAPAVQQSTSNWADEAGAAAEESGTTPVTENDGFSEVKRDRGGRGRGGRGRGDGRGRGRGRGEFKGRGGGRGRGGPRGGAAAPAPAQTAS